MDLDRTFRALADPTRRRLLEELAEREGQTLFELHVRLVTWHGTSLSRQAMSKHLQLLEEANLIRTEWRWRSKHHFLVRAPLRQLSEIWLRPLAYPSNEEALNKDEDRPDERIG